MLFHLRMLILGQVSFAPSDLPTDETIRALREYSSFRLKNVLERVNQRQPEKLLCNVRLKCGSPMQPWSCQKWDDLHAQTGIEFRPRNLA